MKLLIDDTPLQVLPGLAKTIGLNEAIFLQQLHYWLNKSVHTFEDRRWIYNTASDWTEQFPFWSEKTIRRTIKSLKDRGLIETTDRFNNRKYDKTNWFSIVYSAVDKLENQSGQKASGQNDQSVTKASGQVDQMDVVNLTVPIPETTNRERLQTEKLSVPHANKKPLSDHAWFTAWWCFAYQQIVGEKYIYQKKDAGQIKHLLSLLGLMETICRACSYLSLPVAKRFPRGSPTLGGLLHQINEVSTQFDRDLEDRFINARLLPDVEQTDSLKHFQPWNQTA